MSIRGLSERSLIQLPVNPTNCLNEYPYRVLNGNVSTTTKNKTGIVRT